MKLWPAILSLLIGLQTFAATEYELIYAIVTTIGVAIDNNKKPTKIPSNEIRGKCEYKSDSNVAFPGPCNGAELILSQNNHEIARLSIDASGSFQFTNLNTKPYELDLKSKKFKLNDPMKNLLAGSKYLISLKEMR